MFIRPRVLGFREADSELSFRQAFFKAILSTGATTGTVIRHRNFFMNSQAKGGRRYTSREFHMLTLSRDEEEKVIGIENEEIKLTKSQAMKESEDLFIHEEKEENEEKKERELMLNEC